MNNTLYDIRCKFVDLMNNEELTEEQTQELGTELAKELRKLNNLENCTIYPGQELKIIK